MGGGTNILNICEITIVEVTIELNNEPRRSGLSCQTYGVARSVILWSKNFIESSTFRGLQNTKSDLRLRKVQKTIKLIMI